LLDASVAKECNLIVKDIRRIFQHRNDERGRGFRGERGEENTDEGGGREWRWGGRVPTIKVIMRLNYK